MAEKMLLTVREVANATALGRSKVYDLILRGEIESVQIGRSRRVPIDALEAFIARLRHTA